MKIHSPLLLTALLAVITAQTTLASMYVRPVPVKPVPIVAGERCHRCDRLIANRYVAAETIAEGGTVTHKFRTVRCMLAYLAQAPATANRVFVADFETARLVDVERAVFVPIAIDVNTGETNYGMGEIDYAAFRSLDEAEQFARARGVTTMSWMAVVFEAAFLPATTAAR